MVENIKFDYKKESLEHEISLVFEKQYGKLFGIVYRMTESA